jgi:hypothetical protein
MIWGHVFIRAARLVLKPGKAGKELDIGVTEPQFRRNKNDHVALIET